MPSLLPTFMERAVKCWCTFQLDSRSWRCLSTITLRSRFVIGHDLVLTLISNTARANRLLLLSIKQMDKSIAQLLWRTVVDKTDDVWQLARHSDFKHHVVPTQTVRVHSPEDTIATTHARQPNVHLGSFFKKQKIANKPVFVVHSICILLTENHFRCTNKTLVRAQRLIWQQLNENYFRHLSYVVLRSRRVLNWRISRLTVQILT